MKQKVLHANCRPKLKKIVKVRGRCRHGGALASCHRHAMSKVLTIADLMGGDCMTVICVPIHRRFVEPPNIEPTFPCETRTSHLIVKLNSTSDVTPLSHWMMQTRDAQ